MGRTPRNTARSSSFGSWWSPSKEVAEVARRYGVHPNQLTKWRQEFQQRGASIFEPREGKEAEQFRKRIAQLEGLIGPKEIELSVLKNYVDLYAPPDGR